MEDSILSQTISSSFGIADGIFWIFVWAALTAGFAIILYMYSRSIILVAIGSFLPTLLGMWLGFLPFWLVFAHGIAGAITVSGRILLEPGEEDIGEGESAAGSYWEQYGERLKKAYGAKFGYANPAFDQEVDSHVSIMVHNGRGFTRSMAGDWFKRMKRFTEAR